MSDRRYNQLRDRMEVTRRRAYREVTDGYFADRLADEANRLLEADLPRARAEVSRLRLRMPENWHPHYVSGGCYPQIGVFRRSNWTPDLEESFRVAGTEGPQYLERAWIRLLPSLWEEHDNARMAFLQFANAFAASVDALQDGA